jgi:hypothetical protein
VRHLALPEPLISVERAESSVNFDLALRRNFAILESKSLQFRLETFNAFNPVPFFGPAAVNGDSAPTLSATS